MFTLFLVVAGPKIKINIQPDLTKAVKIDVLYDTKQKIHVGDQLPGESMNMSHVIGW